MAPRRDDVIAFARNFIPDDFAFMDSELASLLKAKVTPYLR